MGGGSERRTAQKDAMKRVFRLHKKPLSIQEVHDRAAEIIPDIGIATIYRGVKRLLKEGFIEEVLAPGNAPRFEIRDHAISRHAHFICTECGTIHCLREIRIETPTDEWNEMGVEVEREERFLFGTCRTCRSIVSENKMGQSISSEGSSIS